VTGAFWDTTPCSYTTTATGIQIELINPGPISEDLFVYITPEPGTVLLLGTGAVLGLRRRKR